MTTRTNIILQAVATLALLSVGAVHAWPITSVDLDRTKTNIVNNLGVTITASLTDGTTSLPSGSPQDLISYWETTGPLAWESDGGESLTLQWDSIQNIKTIKTWSSFAGYTMTGTTIETSNDGVNWTTQSANLNNVDTSTDEITLNTAVDAKYLRITADTIDDVGTDRWRVNQLRVFGDTGTLTVTGDTQDILSEGLGVSQSAVGTITQIDDLVTDTTLERELAYNLTTDEGLEFDFGQAVPIKTVGLVFATSGFDSNVQILVKVSNDGANFTTAVDQTGGWNTSEVNFLDLIGYDYQYMQVLVGSTTSSDIRFSDIMVFIPEPASLTLLLLATTGLLHRRNQRG